jgi:hypothetical protein
VGSAPEFVRSRQDKVAREGRWDASGLAGPEAELVRGDERASKCVRACVRLLLCGELLLLC